MILSLAVRAAPDALRLVVAAPVLAIHAASGRMADALLGPEEPVCGCHTTEIARVFGIPGALVGVEQTTVRSARGDDLVCDRCPDAGACVEYGGCLDA